MAEYRCLADLQGKTLKYEDCVILKGIKYRVLAKFLSECEGGDNSKIFDILSISSKEAFAAKAYGYEHNGGAWPECKRNDYEALTRCVIELFKLIEKDSKKYKIKGKHLIQLGKEASVKLLKDYGAIFKPEQWSLDTGDWYYWIYGQPLHHNIIGLSDLSDYEELNPFISPEKEQWYKITTPGLIGISPEQVKELITKYRGLINSEYDYTSKLGIYTWTKNERVRCISKCDLKKDAIEVSPKTEIITIKQEEKHENQFQRKKARIERGTRPEGSTVCGRRSKASVAVGHLGYRKVTGI